MVADIAGQFRIEYSCRDQNRRADSDCDPARGADAGARSPWRRSARLHVETIETRAGEGQFERAVLSKAELKSAPEPSADRAIAAAQMQNRREGQLGADSLPRTLAGRHSCPDTRKGTHSRRFAADEIGRHNRLRHADEWR